MSEQKADPTGLAWRTSSYSVNGGGQCVEVTDLWRKSSHSGPNGSCVEVAALPATHGMRDTRNRDKAALFFTSHEWDAFLTAAKNHQL